MDSPEEKLLVVVGEGPVSSALRPLAELVGLRVVLATEVAEVTENLDAAGSVVVLSHHEELDGPALEAVLTAYAAGAGPAYVGAMGSRRTQQRRRDWLLARGWSEEQLRSIHGPAGLDIGADTPAEIALSILAELVAVHRGRAASGSLRDTEGPIHPELTPGTATCPGG